MDDLALPVSFVGVKNWRVIQLLMNYKVAIEIGFIVMVGATAVGVVVWLAWDARTKRR